MVRDSQHLYTCRHWAILSGLPLQIHVKPSNLGFNHLLMQVANELHIYLVKMSKCLRTYGPQIIRVPQLQSED